jgi:hypothetical protein
MRKDAANSNRLAADFRTAQVLDDLKSAGHEVDWSVLQDWLAAIDAGYQSAELAALKRARDRALAHTATPNEGKRELLSMVTSAR